MPGVGASSPASISAAEFRFEAVGQRGEAAERRRDCRFDAGAQQAGEQRRGAGRGHGDGDRVAVDHRGRDEAAQFRPVDHVHRDAARLCGFGQSEQIGFGGTGADRDGAAVQKCGREARGEHQFGAGAAQHVGFPLGGFTGAEHERAAALQVKEDGQMAHQAGSILSTITRIPL
jgi:hypothetical protein